jgi:hypothetical protein
MQPDGMMIFAGGSFPEQLLHLRKYYPREVAVLLAGYHGYLSLHVVC